jgi:hypothetical protein
MRTFETPQPIAVTLELGVGDVLIAASDRSDTVVDVQPGDPTKKVDVAAAQQTRVEYANGALLVKGPKGWRQLAPWGGGESIDVRIELPTGSSLNGTVGVASLRATGGLGDCRYHAGMAEIAIEHAGRVELRSGAGNVSAEAIGGAAEIKTAGTIRIGRIEGTAVIKNTNGATTIGDITGDARITAANGPIVVGVARSSVVAKSANGEVRVDEIGRGSVVLQSAMGAIEVGIPPGVAAWLDVETKFGRVHNDLEDADRPGPGEDAVEIHAHTSMGDITIRRPPSTDSRGGAR